VTCYEGSIVVIYDLSPNAGQTLAQLQESQARAFSRNIDLGFPIINVEALTFGNSAANVLVQDGVVIGAESSSDSEDIENDSLSQSN
jgi:hypothetical protein